MTPAASLKDELAAEISDLRAFAISMSSSVSLLDDLVQDTLLRARSKSDRLQFRLPSSAPRNMT
jgi:RNA polymerase sigma-70 factor, ECF subfamily